MTERDVTTKVLAGLAIKDAEKGEVEAIVATIGVVDRDYEVILPGAIQDGAKVKMSGYGHDVVFGEMPVGRGAIHIEDAKAVFRGKLFLSTQRGREAFDVLKEMGSDQEWSFGFRTIGSEQPDDEWRKQGAQRLLTKLEAFEVSPVVLGAGIGTQTVAAKEADAAAARVKAEADAAAAKAAQDAAEAKAAQEALEQKARVAAALEEHNRIQRTLHRMGYV